MVGLPTEHKDPPDNPLGMFHVKQLVGIYFGVFYELDRRFFNKNLLKPRVFHVKHAQSDLPKPFPE